MPSSYTVQLESLDGLENLKCKTTNVTTEDDLVVLEVNHRLPLNRLWICTVLAYNCQQNTILSGVELSKCISMLAHEWCGELGIGHNLEWT